MNTRARTIAWAVVGAAVMLLIMAVTVTMLQTGTVVDLIRNDQKAGIERAKVTKSNTEQIKQLAETIRSCTDPAGECYKQGQERTGAAVASINEVIIYAAACADQPGVDSVPKIRNCVRALLADSPTPSGSR